MGTRGAGRGPVVVIDDHDLLSSSLVVMMTRRGFDVRRLHVGRRESILAQAGSTTHGVALVDIDLGLSPTGKRLSGLDLIPPLRLHGWQPVIMSGSSREDEIAVGVAAGSVAVVTKSSSSDTLLSTVSTVLDGGCAMSAEEREHYLSRAERAESRRGGHEVRLEHLTDRESQVLALLAEGYRATAVAEELFTAITTVRSQIRSVLSKLGVSSQLEAVAYLHAARDRLHTAERCEAPSARDADEARAVRHPLG